MAIGDGGDGTGEPGRRPRVLVWGRGEAGLEPLIVALERRAIEATCAGGVLEEAIRALRPNLVLLVGDASSDDGARGIDDARRAGGTPVIVATDAEPLDRRLAPFQYGAAGIVVRRGDAEEMAGEIQHLLAESARRVAERTRRSGHGRGHLDELVGLGSRELRLSDTPHEGLPRSAAAAAVAAASVMPGGLGASGDPISVPAWPSDEVPTLEIRDPTRGAERAEDGERAEASDSEARATSAIAGGLLEWGEDENTRRQESEEVARWRRLSASDRGTLRTPEARAALDALGVPRPDPRAVAGGDAQDRGAHARDEPAREAPHAREEGGRVGGLEDALPAVLAPTEIDGPTLPGGARAALLLDEMMREAERTTAQREIPEAILERERALASERRGSTEPDAEQTPAQPRSSPVPRARSIPPPSRAIASRAIVSPSPASPSPGSPSPASAPSASPSSASPRSASPRSASPSSGTAAANAPPGGGPEQASSRVLLGTTPPSRPPLEDRASTLRASALPRPRASVAPAVVMFIAMSAAVALLVSGRATSLGTLPSHAIAARPPVPGPDPGSAPGSVHTGSVDPGSDPASAPAPDPGPVPDRVPGSVPVPDPDPAPVAVPDPAPVAVPDPAPVPVAQPSVLSARALSESLLEEARAAASGGDARAARALLERAVEADPNNPHALAALAEAHLEAREAAAAIPLAERAVALRRRRPEYRVLLGDARELAGDHARAEAEWRAALELDPDHELARRRLGR